MLRRAAALALMVLAACGGAGGPSLACEKTDIQGKCTANARVRLHIEVAGAESITHDTETVLHFEEITGDRVPASTRFVSVSAIPAAFTLLPDGRQIVFSADLSPGLYDGPGTYRLDPKAAATPLPGASGVTPSGAYLQLVTLRPTPAEVVYGRILSPCTLGVSPGLRRGSVDCPKLADTRGRTVSFRWSWELI